MNKWLDKWMEHCVRKVARGSSRRGFLQGVGTLLIGAPVLPLLPVARAAAGKAEDPGDPHSCDYWRYCAIDGFLCSCCGGSRSSCPPGTEMSPATWIGTCRNPSDGKNYIISYNDCCGKTGCGNCLCTRSEGDRPVYRPSASNDINWCLGASSMIYHCTTAIVLGVSTEE